ncbi:MAG TPA: STAS domain-containing protein [Gaiellaceae bacterium]|nr:STAS domain-containing protein [Gaiellaceae bacterium]
MDDFAVRVEALPDGGLVAHVAGELDMATTPRLEEALAGRGRAERLVVDLGECSFLDSSAVRFLVQAAREREAAGGELVLATDDPGIRRVLEITAVDTVLTVHPSVSAALRTAG